MPGQTLSRLPVEIRTSRGEGGSPLALAVFLLAYLAILGLIALPKGALLVQPVGASTQAQRGP
ncbi:MAG: hypothetical protein MUF73_18670 [Rhodobacteraceae bacterium]|jgi:hypothetical protein|nr:hypothetical protein [Paracoccaceae bacterium]